jgi:hypothetical protein
MFTKSSQSAFIFAIVHIAILAGCSKLKDYPTAYSGDIIIVGNGGGMTGKELQIHLLQDGRVYRTFDLGGNFEELPRLSANEYMQITNNYQSLGFQNLMLEEPGNRYKYIIFKNKKINHKIQWGKEGIEAKLPELFYAHIMALIKSKSE